MTRPFMTDVEAAFLASHLDKNTSRVWEWGSGGSSFWLAERAREVTSVEHDPTFAAKLDLANAPRNWSLILAQPEEWWSFDNVVDDGDRGTFRRYVETYTGRGINVVIIDGRARVACARQIVEGAQFGPDSDTKIFLHDCGREEYRRIFEDRKGDWGDAYFEPVARMDNLLLMRPRGAADVGVSNISPVQLAWALSQKGNK